MGGSVSNNKRVVSSGKNVVLRVVTSEVLETLNEPLNDRSPVAFAGGSESHCEKSVRVPVRDPSTDCCVADDTLWNEPFP